MAVLKRMKLQVKCFSFLHRDMESVCDDWPSSEDDSLLSEAVCAAFVHQTVTLV